MSHHFLILFGGSEGTTFFADIIGKTHAVYIPGVEPLERHHAYMSGVTDDAVLTWLETLYTKPSALADVDAWIASLAHAISGVTPIDDPQKIVGAHATGIKMRPTVLTGDALTRPTLLKRLLHAAPADPFASLLALLKAQECHLVLFRRDNLLKRAVSSYRMTREKKSQFIRRNLSPSTIDPVELEAEMKNYRGYLELANQIRTPAIAMGIPVIDIAYEDILVDAMMVFERFFDALGLSVADDLQALSQESRWKKSTSDNLREVLINYDEIYRYFEKTPDGQYFD
ncbi:MAG: hypothetical protein O3A51_03850 [Verrucomicrobia bacterium]|nr:hypothetical protein [Verrucomicrobiota bacterium]